MLYRLTDELQQIGIKLNTILDGVSKREALSRNEILILFHLYHTTGATSIKEMTNFLHANQGNTSTLCKRLSALGYIKRVRCLQDERSVELYLTDKGRDKCDLIKKMVYRKFDENHYKNHNLLHSTELIGQVLSDLLRSFED